MGLGSSTSLGGKGFTDIPEDPAAQIGFELDPQDARWSFAPEYYPDDFKQAKDRELDRTGQQCEGENVSIKKVKNREYHVSGVVLAGEVPILNAVMDYTGKIDLLSPLTPSGGIECVIKDSELGNVEGYDGMYRQWRFEYTLDLVSTGTDEHNSGENAIVSRVMRPSSEEIAQFTGPIGSSP